MAEVKVLIEGYVKEEKGVEYASCTTTLIQSNAKNIIVDPGMDRKKLLNALGKKRLKPRDIDYVILTHNHMDHMLLTGIFENAKVLDNSSIYSFDGRIEDHDGKIPGTDIKIISTPGHDQFHCSVLVDTKEFGKVAIVADVFWWTDKEEQKIDYKNLIEHKDPYVKDQKQLDNSRKKILKIADYIIPGHGGMFKVK